MRNTTHSILVAAAAALALGLAGCGGADSTEAAAQQREQAAALQHAMQLAKAATAAKVKGERAKTEQGQR
jgi:hypothetical protein